MRLDRLDLTRYGRFTDRSLTFAPVAAGAPDLHIIYGPNEAGKSTLFSAWLDLLFGIPLRTRYDFLHPGPTMQIGARLQHAGAPLELKRLKRNASGLLDGHDAALPEALVQSAVGGLSREGYAAMFSLDDETLEKGGDSILASRGDLGEMLFSASAGLANLAPQLDGLRSGLDGFHRSGKRSGWLYDAKKQLAELDKQRRELDVSASALQRLMREAAAAEQDWRDSRDRETTLQTELDRLQELAATQPLLERVQALQAQLAPLQHLPPVSDVQASAAMAAETARLTLQQRSRDRALRLHDLGQQTAALGLDLPALTAAAAIEAAEALRPEHDTAQKDLPRRRDEADAAQARLKALAAQLGQPQASAADLCLPAQQMSALRAALTLRSGVQNAAANALAETESAKGLLDAERARLGDPGPVQDEAVLLALLGRLRTHDPNDALARAQRDCDQAKARQDKALAALAPWRGTATALAALDVPTAAQLADWDSGLEAARQAEGDANRDAKALSDELDRLQNAAQTRSAAVSGFGLADAAVSRSRREALWASHLQALSVQSASAFEQALREDDRISALLAENLAEARHADLHQGAAATATARLETAKARALAAQAAQQQLAAALGAACAALALPLTSLADLRSWLALRQLAMTEAQSLAQAEVDLGRASTAHAQAQQLLAQALGLSTDSPLPPFEILQAQAQARVDAAAQRLEARARLQQLSRALQARQQAATAAEAAAQTWVQNWHSHCAGSLLEGYDASDPGLGAVLDLLDQLAPAQQTAAALQDRIDKMQANQRRFIAAKALVLQQLQQDPASPWPEVLARLRRAQDADRDHGTLSRQIAVEQHQEAQDQLALLARQQDLHALAAAIGHDAAASSLADHIALCRETGRLRQELRQLQDALRDRPAPTSSETADVLRQALAKLRTELQILRNETEARLAGHLEARRRLDAIGGDDALARLAGLRENLLLDIAERARSHLAAKFGMIAFETALRRYRDEHRSAMLTRASEAFNRLSRGAYRGLAAQPDGAQEVLVALSANGGAKLAVDLSKGTRFQLYLALRIAGYHELAASRPTVPFIADDIMETFDDARSAQAFSLLGEMSRVGQVIYLTHHRHLCDIAKASCPGAQIIELQPQG